MGYPRFIALSVLALFCAFGKWARAQDQASISRLLETVLKIQPPIDTGISKPLVRTPDHMLDFYHQFSSTYYPDHLNDNIIRNIFPLQGSRVSDNSELLSNLMIFNLSCVQSGEAISSAQLSLSLHDFILHPHHKASHTNALRRKLFSSPALQLRIFRLSSSAFELKPVELGLIPLASTVSQKSLQLDVTAFLLDTIATSAENLQDTLVAVRLESRNNETLLPKSAVHTPTNTTHMAASYLIVFSEENNFGHFPLPSLHTDLLASMVNSSLDGENEIPKSTGKSANRVQLSKEKDSSESFGSYDSRVKRSLKDNQLTDNESDDRRDEDGYYVFPHKSKTAMKRKSYKLKNKGKPHLNDHIIGRRWQDCRRKRLTVNFADIGWGEWVLSPQAFEAYYCDGACSYPLIRSMRPTNHATLQSMVRAVGGHDVPEPRCVADSLSPVTLLYIDQVGNIVLKNYPAMSVRSCACR